MHRGVLGQELAETIVTAFDGGSLCEAPTIAGPGFLNSA